MHIDPNSLWKTDQPRFVVVLDAEMAYDMAAHRRYQASERFDPTDAEQLSVREQRNDPRITPRWACQYITTLSWLVMIDGDDGLRPLRLETRGLPEHDEAAVLTAFLSDMEALGTVQLVTWGGFHADIPQMLMGAMAAGLRVPGRLKKLLSPWQRAASGHLDLLTEICGGANPVHLAEVAARLGIPAKLTCRPDLVSRLMERGKWADVRSVCEGDVLTTAAILMRWRHLAGGGMSALEGTQRLTTFVAEHCSHRTYAADWIRFGREAMREAFAIEALKMAVLAPQLGN